jgi:hypothetical protein
MLGQVRYGAEYSIDNYQGLSDLSTVLQCRKYRQNHYHRRIEHHLVSRIMIIELNVLTPQRGLL